MTPFAKNISPTAVAEAKADRPSGKTRDTAQAASCGEGATAADGRPIPSEIGVDRLPYHTAADLNLCGLTYGANGRTLPAATVGTLLSGVGIGEYRILAWSPSSTTKDENHRHDAAVSGFGASDVPRFERIAGELGAWSLRVANAPSDADAARENDDLTPSVRPAAHSLDEVEVADRLSAHSTQHRLSVQPLTLAASALRHAPILFR